MPKSNKEPMLKHQEFFLSIIWVKFMISFIFKSKRGFIHSSLYHIYILQAETFKHIYGSYDCTFKFLMNFEY